MLRKHPYSCLARRSNSEALQSLYTRVRYMYRFRSLGLMQNYVVLSGDWYNVTAASFQNGRQSRETLVGRAKEVETN